MRSKLLPILTTMVWLLAGCSKAVDEPVVQQPVPQPIAQEPEPENVPIDFNAQVMDHVTTRSGSTPTAVYGDYFNESTEKYEFKEGYTSETQLKTSETPDGFGVFAYFTGNSNFGTGEAAPTDNYERQVVMWNQKVTSTDGTTWSYTPKRYWPANAAKMSFFAYAPYMDGSNIENPKLAQIISITEGTEKYSYLAKNDFVAPSIKYTWSHTNPIDLMWGTAREDAIDVNGVLIKHEGDDYTDMRRPDDNYLHWNFKHVLSRIKFYIANYLSTDKMLDQVEAIGFVNAKTVKCLKDEEFAPGKNKRGWYISFSDDGGGGDYNIWNKIKELDMRMMITGVKLSGFYDNRVLELMNDGKNAKWGDGVKYGSDYELRPMNPNICADIPDDKIAIDNATHILQAKPGYVLEDVINSLASFKIDYGEGVYDISAEAGKDYLSLGVALDDVPDESKVMGMSVRFINSLKDKYEQYKYKGATIEDVNFNNVANWEQEEEGTLEIPLNIALTKDDDEDDFKHYLLLIPQEADFDDIGENIKVEVEFRIITHVQFEVTTFDWKDKNVVDFVPFDPPSSGTSSYPRDLWVSTQVPSSMYGYIMKDLQSNKSYKVVIRLGKVMSILYEITDWDDNYDITIPSFE